MEGANAAWLRALKLTAQVEHQTTLAALVAEQAARRPDAVAVLGEDRSLTYAELASRASRWSRWALARSLERGDTVALLAPNSPEYLAVWLGLSAVGVSVALVNPSLRGPSLEHALAAARPRLVIEPGQYAEADGLSGAPLSEAERRGTALEDLALLIYTSGTTGLPKAARLSHRRILTWAHWFAGLSDASPSDRLYDPLPLCHSVGGVLAPGMMWVAGGSVVVRARFSASRFWHDVAETRSTMAQYIGELFRYLLAQPESSLEQAHALRLAVGNGLAPDVWEAAKARFALPRILEFYAATEGNFSLVNVEGEPGALGRIPGFLAHRFPLALARFDPATGQPWRDDEGRCRRCGIDEPGEAIARLAANARFEGYTDPAASAAKVLRDVFEPGDAWLRSGDLMRKDAGGFYRFVDRVGDTFRWKGENVATTEVAAALVACPGVEQACVFGVKIAGADGRAGMAALQVAEAFDAAPLAAHLLARLPAHALPLYLRLVREIDRTDTLKPMKQRFAEEGYDPEKVADPLYALEDGRYVPLKASRTSSPAMAMAVSA